MIILIQLTSAGLDVGPFNLYSDVSGFLSAFATGVTRQELLDGYVATVPDGTQVVRLISTGDCTNSKDLGLGYTQYSLGMISIPNTGYGQPYEACSGTPVYEYVFSDSDYTNLDSVEQANAQLFTDSALTTPFNGQGLWYSFDDKVYQIDASGYITDSIATCTCNCTEDILIELEDSTYSYVNSEITFTARLLSYSESCFVNQFSVIYTLNYTSDAALVPGNPGVITAVTQASLNSDASATISIPYCENVHYRVVVTSATGQQCFSPVKSMEILGCPGETYYYGTYESIGGIVDLPTDQDIVVTSGNIEYSGADAQSIDIPFNSGIDDFIWFAVPESVGLRTSWYVNDFNQGAIGGGRTRLGNLFGDPYTVDVNGTNFYLYISSARTNVATMTIS